MELYVELKTLFQIFNSHGIAWCVVRDGWSAEEINNADDLDISVSERDMGLARELLESCGWHTPRLNPNAYGHIQFYKWVGARIYKIDVIGGMYFADGRYEMCDAERIYGAGTSVRGADGVTAEEQSSGADLCGCIHLPPPDEALELLLLHVIFDKGSLSEKNCRGLERALKAAGVFGEDLKTAAVEKIAGETLSAFEEGMKAAAEIETGGEGAGVLGETAEALPGFGETGTDQKRIRTVRSVAREILEEDRDLKSLAKYREELLKAGCACARQRGLWGLRRKISQKLWRHATKRSTYALLGVDGSGKSAAVDALASYFGDQVHVEYMGFRSYVTKEAQAWADGSAKKSKIPGVNLFRSWTSFYRDMKLRYRDALKSGKRLIIFDRYPWEACDNARNSAVKCITFLYFRILFPRPQNVIYLYCPAEVSFERKDDIVDREKFLLMKERFDGRYLGRRGVLAVDTGKYDREEVKAMLAEYVCLTSQGKMR